MTADKGECPAGERNGLVFMDISNQILVNRG